MSLTLRVASIAVILALPLAALEAVPALAEAAPPAPPAGTVTPAPPPPAEPPVGTITPAPPPQPQPTSREFSPNELIDAGHRFFGGVSRGLAMVVEKAVSQWGQPNGYVLGEEASGAFVGG